MRLYEGYTWLLPKRWKARLDDRYKSYLDKHSSVRKYLEIAKRKDDLQLEMKYEKEFEPKGCGRFKVQIYEGGKVELHCMDDFEKVFGLSEEVLKRCNIIDILKPELFKEHRLIVDSLFDILYELSMRFVKEKPPMRKHHKPDA